MECRLARVDQDRIEDNQDCGYDQKHVCCQGERFFHQGIFKPHDSTEVEKIPRCQPELFQGTVMLERVGQEVHRG